MKLRFSKNIIFFLLSIYFFLFLKVDFSFSAVCYDECSFYGQICPNGGTCGNYDSDPCLECPSQSSPSCSNECSFYGQSSCFGSNYYKICGNYDADSCLEWSSPQYCAAGYVCQNGSCVLSSTCQNECSFYGQKTCSSSTSFKTCGNYDSDSCLEWSSPQSCPSGYTCQNGECVYQPPSCQNECSFYGQTEKRCSQNNLQQRTCGNYDADACLEWSSWSTIENCDLRDGCQGSTYYDYYCSNNSCSFTTYPNDSRCVAPCQNECSFYGQKTCSSSTSFKTCGNYDSDSCLEWSSPQSCPSGYTCQNGECVYQPPSCQNECSFYGQTEKRCSQNNLQQRTCGNYDADACLEWSSWSTIENCDLRDGCQGSTYYDYYCSNNSCSFTTYPNDSRCVAPCQNECSFYGQKTCSSSTSFKTCGNYDSDSCLEWSSPQSCPSGYTCQNGECVYQPPSCQNECSFYGQTEKRCSQNNLQQRTCGNYDADACLEWSSWSTIENCDLRDGCQGSTYYDYFCSNNACSFTTYPNDSRCVAPCQNECSFYGQKTCSSSTSFKTCGNYDSDSCLEWSSPQSCPSGYTCQNGECVYQPPSCQNECSFYGQTEKRCSQNNLQQRTCGNYDADACLEWSSWSTIENCDLRDGCQGSTYYDYYCSNNACSFTTYPNDSRCVAPCQNECSFYGQKTCSSSTSFKTCGNYDSDSCLEWSSPQSCPSGYTCQNGECVYQPPSCQNECSFYGQTEKRCSQNNLQQRTCGNYDADACLEWSSWSTIENCDLRDGCQGSTYYDYYCSNNACSFTTYPNDSRCATACSVDIKANGYDGSITIPYNSSVSLSWTSSNANMCLASGDWSGGKPTIGSETIYNLTSNKEFILTCSGVNYQCSDRVVVLTQKQANLLVKKFVRNISDGGPWQESVFADPEEVLVFSIQIRADNADLENVIVKDVLPDKIHFLGNLTLDNQPISGNILSGINIGRILAGQTKTISFRATVAKRENFHQAETRLLNSAIVSSGSISASSTATIIVKLTPTLLKTGIANNIFSDSFVLPLFSSLFLVWLFREKIIQWEKIIDERKKQYLDYKARKLLQLKIAKLKLKEKLLK
jgi:hypothetical protein